VAEPLPAHLREAIIPPAVLEVVSRLQDRGHQAYLVGGCVRDLVSGRAPKDYDVATSARPEEVQASFRKVIPTGIQHGTVTVMSRGEPVEVTTFRTEGEYLDGRRPSQVAFHSRIEDDLSRRDFTINAMAFDPVRRELVDPFGGQQDLKARIVRAVGEPAARFAEDGLRCLRAARFSALLGFRLDPATHAAIAPSLQVFRKVARERVREELTRLLLSDHPDQGLGILAETGLLQEIVPELRPEDLPRATSAVQRSPRTVEARMAAFLHLLPSPEAAEAALRRLTFSNKVVDQAVQLIRHLLPPDAPGASDAQLRRWVAALGRELVDSALRLSEAAFGADLQALRARLDRLLEAGPPLSARELALDGTQIMAVLGVGPSRIVGEATRFLLDQVLDQPELNSPDSLARLLTEWSSKRRA
jgi:tRNA nucleotidyltransferase (CCA-adding enzyme)